MISFAGAGPGETPRLRLRPGITPLPGLRIQDALAAGGIHTPGAGLNLREDGVMEFSAALRPARRVLIPSGQSEFVTGLWQRDVIECFFGNPENGRYLEIHLAPTGQWWACVFTGIRVAEIPEGHPLPLSVVEHRRDKEGTRWEASVQVPAEVLCRLLQARSFMDLRANLCATIYPGTGPAAYFSLAPLPGEKPNFHQPGAWLEMTG